MKGFAKSKKAEEEVLFFLRSFFASRKIHLNSIDSRVILPKTEIYKKMIVPPAKEGTTPKILLILFIIGTAGNQQN